MRKFAYLVMVAAAALAPVAAIAADETTAAAAMAPVSGAVQINAGMMLYTSNGYRLAPVYRVSRAGDPQIILNGKLITVPASTLSDTGGKVATSLTKKELGKAS